MGLDAAWGEYRDRFALALERDRRALLPVGLWLDQQAPGLLGYEHVVARLARRGLDPRGSIDRVADHSEVKPSAPADRSHYNRSSVDPDPNAQVALIALAHPSRD